MWKQQILATIEGYRLESFLIGDHTPKMVESGQAVQMRPNPEFLLWHRQDQRLSAWIQASLSESAMVRVVRLRSTKDIWNALETNFASQPKAKIMQYKLQIQTMKKESLAMTEYLSKMKSCCDLLRAAGCKIEEEDQILHILSGLGREYDPVMVTITSKVEASTVQEVTALLLSFEARLETAKHSPLNLEGSQPTANIANTFESRREGGYPPRGNFSGRMQGR